MPSWVATAIVFGGWAIALITGLAVVSLGIMLVLAKDKNAPDPNQEISLQLPAPKVAVTVRASGGILLIIVGLAEMVFVIIQYPKALWAFLLVAGAGAADGRRNKPRLRSLRGRRSRKRAARSPRRRA